MCRIAGIISRQLSSESISEKVSAMCNALKHGGPDDVGLFVDKRVNIALGHRRLALIDLTKNGHQPMADIHRKAWITFNGEIYNYKELKAELIKAGVEFNTNSDTEVIINAYLFWGEPAFAKLRGMFAFVLYDIKKGKSYLVRDTTGIKPLYYHINSGQLSFASEVRAFKVAGLEIHQDEAWPVRFLALGHIPEPYTTLSNVLSLPKGHYLCWNHHDDTYITTSYQQATTQLNYITNANEANEQIEAYLKLAIKRQLIADAPIGVFLSGGVDSSLISLLANQQKTLQLNTVSIYFNEKSYNEQLYQNIVLNHLKGEKHAHLVQQHDFETFFPAIINAMDMPTTDGINTWFISKYAHEDGLKAVLSGLGADELFGGYPSFKRINYLKYLRKIPKFILSAASNFTPDKYKKSLFLQHKSALADYLLLRGLFASEDIAKILDTDVSQVNEILFSEPILPEPDDYSKEHAAWFETNMYMQNQLLRDTDVMSMNHGLEVRVPFLDEDFQHLVQNISPAIRFDNNLPKKLLIDSFKEILPTEIWNRPKMGFTFPFQEWMSQHSEISEASLYHGKVAQNAVLKFKNGQMHWSKIFALYQIQLHV